MQTKGSQFHQLQLLMTPKEILGQYQPLDADRDDAWDSDDSYDASADFDNPGVETDDQLWDRKYEEGDNIELYELRAKREGSDTQRSRTTGGRSNQAYAYQTSGGRTHEGYYRHFNTQTLNESLRTHGVQQPISLGSQEGMMGKPQIVGGHHRLAWAAREAPNTPLPVLHFEDIHDAKKASYKKYT